MASSGSEHSPYPFDHGSLLSQLNSNRRNVEPQPLAQGGLPTQEQQHQHHRALQHEMPSGSQPPSPDNVSKQVHKATSQDTDPCHSSPSSPLSRSAISFDAADNPQCGAFETRPLDEPGCFVLVPVGYITNEKVRRTVKNYSNDLGGIPGRKPRRAMDESEREAIKLNRKFGVCLRCKLFKEKVAPPFFPFQCIRWRTGILTP